MYHLHFRLKECPAFDIDMTLVYVITFNHFNLLILLKVSTCQCRARKTISMFVLNRYGHVGN